MADDAFRASDYRSASRFANHALIEMPENGELIAFFAQTLFALGDYRGAASAIHDAANVVDPTRLGKVAQIHQQHPDYAEQMQQLNQYIAADPESPDALFTRGFQLGFSGERDAAVRDLNQANRFVPNDPLTLALIDAFDSGIAPPLLAPSRNLSSDAPIVMDGPPPTIDSSAPAPRPSVSVDGHDHSGHDHTH